MATNDLSLSFEMHLLGRDLQKRVEREAFAFHLEFTSFGPSC